MRPLTDHTPKPLLAAGGRMLIEWQIAALAAAGIRDFVINTAHHAKLIEQTLGDGSRYSVRIRYSHEGNNAEDALETLGGILQALPLLGPRPFLVVSGDIVTDFDYATLRNRAARIDTGARDAHFVLIDNPPYHPQGDMGLGASDPLAASAASAASEESVATLRPPCLTYANIAVFAPHVFAAEKPGRRRLFPWAFQLVEQGRVSAERYPGRWYNVGTPQDLENLDRELTHRPLGRGEARA